MSKTPKPGTSTGAKMVVRWNLRQAMAEHGMFHTTDLIEPLAQRVELSRQMVHRVVTKTPQWINLDRSRRCATSSSAPPTTCSRSAACRSPGRRRSTTAAPGSLTCARPRPPCVARIRDDGPVHGPG